VHAALRTLEGPLQLEGKGTWSNGAAPSFLVTARVPAQHQEQLAPLLRLIAVERGAGNFELSSNQSAFGPWFTNAYISLYANAQCPAANAR